MNKKAKYIQQTEGFCLVAKTTTQNMKHFVEEVKKQNTVESRQCKRTLLPSSCTYVGLY